MKHLKNMEPKQVRRITITLVIIDLFVLVLAAVSGGLTLKIVAGVLAVVTIVFDGLFYRCPKCGKYLGESGGNYCRHCGTRL